MERRHLIYFTKHNILRADYRYHIGNHMSPRHLVERRQMGKARGP